MTVRPVLTLPAAVLKRVADPVERIGEAERSLAIDLLDTMRVSPGCVGLAAPQIGVSVRAFSLDVSGHGKADSCHGELVLFNPELVVAHAPVVAREGCMSVPDYTGNVARASEVVVRGLGVDGEARVLEANAFEARALLHEIDHLDGMLFLDRVSSLKTDVFRRKTYQPPRTSPPDPSPPAPSPRS